MCLHRYELLQLSTDLVFCLVVCRLGSLDFLGYEAYGISTLGGGVLKLGRFATSPQRKQRLTAPVGLQPFYDQK